MSPSLIHKKLVKPIIQVGMQNAIGFLNQPVKAQPRMDGSIFTQVVSHLKHTAAYHGLISLSAPQIMFKNRIFVILKKPLITYSKWTGYEELFLTKKPQECYDAIVNPQLLGHSNFKIKGDQQCPSADGFKFKVWVPLTNAMGFVNYSQKIEKSKIKPVFEHCERQFTGFYGRVFDHEFRHLEGMMVNIPQVCNNQIYLSDQAKEQPQNFIVLRNLRFERQYFNEENIEKSLKKQFQMKREQESQIKQKSKKVSRISQSMSPEQIPDKIDDKVKEQLTKSYEKMKGKQKKVSENSQQRVIERNRNDIKNRQSEYLKKSAYKTSKQKSKK